MLNSWRSPVLIISTIVGKGNVSVGEAIKELFPPDAQVHHMSVEELLPANAVEEDLLRYKFISNNFPFLLNLVYRIPIFYYRKFIREKVFKITDLRRLADTIKSSNAKTVICISHRPAFWVSAAKAREGLDFDLWGVLTEFGKTLGWRYIFWEAMNGYISPIERKRLDYKFPSGLQYIKSDPFVISDFRKIAQVKGDTNKVLFVAGYWGQIFFDKAVKIIRFILEELPQIQITVVCGKNDILFKKLTVRFGHYPASRIMIFGEKDSLADTMKECMSVITKPGFSTVAEAYAAGRAIFLVPGMPVAEDHNADYAIKNYGALWFNNEAFADWYHLRYTADKKIDKNIACPICSSAEYKNVLYDYDRLTHVPGAYHVLRCAGCDLYYVNPRYLKEGIPDLYPDSYFSKSKMRLFLLSIYDSLKKSIAIKILWRCVLSRLRITGEIDLGTIRLGPGSKVLDIGCATGTFLSHIHWLTGCKVNGIELNNAARLEANGKLGENAVFADLFEEKRLLEGSFDLVTMFFVIEHLHEPAAYMAKISALLKDDGWLVISLPNRDSLFFSAFGRRWSCLHLPQHFQFFSLPVLARFLNKNGFEIKAVKHSSNTRTLIASLQIIFYGKRFIPGRDKKAPFTQDNILLKFLLWPVCFVCACLGRSDTMYIYARKTDRKK